MKKNSLSASKVGKNKTERYQTLETTPVMRGKDNQKSKSTGKKKTSSKETFGPRLLFTPETPKSPPRSQIEIGGTVETVLRNDSPILDDNSPQIINHYVQDQGGFNITGTDSDDSDDSDTMAQTFPNVKSFLPPSLIDDVTDTQSQPPDFFVNFGNHEVLLPKDITPHQTSSTKSSSTKSSQGSSKKKRNTKSSQESTKSKNSPSSKENTTQKSTKSKNSSSPQENTTQKSKSKNSQENTKPKTKQTTLIKEKEKPVDIKIKKEKVQEKSQPRKHYFSMEPEDSKKSLRDNNNNNNNSEETKVMIKKRKQEKSKPSQSSNLPILSLNPSWGNKAPGIICGTLAQTLIALMLSLQNNPPYFNDKK